MIVFEQNNLVANADQCVLVIGFSDLECGDLWLELGLQLGNFIIVKLLLVEELVLLVLNKLTFGLLDLHSDQVFCLIFLRVEMGHMLRL